jgi:hypothetical protein
MLCEFPILEPLISSFLIQFPRFFEYSRSKIDEERIKIVIANNVKYIIECAESPFNKKHLNQIIMGSNFVMVNLNTDLFLMIEEMDEMMVLKRYLQYMMN